MTSPMQRSLLGLTVLIIVSLMIVSLTAFLLGRRLTVETRRRDGLLLDMIANISGNLDRLDTGLNDIAVQTEVARNRLRQLVALHRENLFVCAVLAEKQRLRRTSGEKRMRRRKRRRRFAMSR
ncbi:hypothetical protein X777_10102 [Ooceraea biroi]|uniref:Uncharacterized protein n=2 Tax=Ooceraea biroi TaxID=2015173 RepID=A0A026X2F9_OOCBI|nr:hypothetical protein X777_10102 [Ooceraea biroi]